MFCFWWLAIIGDSGSGLLVSMTSGMLVDTAGAGSPALTAAGASARCSPQAPSNAQVTRSAIAVRGMQKFSRAGCLSGDADHRLLLQPLVDRQPHASERSGLARDDFRR
jgi:hypothetical protein